MNLDEPTVNEFNINWLRDLDLSNRTGQNVHDMK